MDNKLKISVVTVCYNAVKDIERTMLSVLNQTYPNIEYIVIDGGSTDGTMDIIRKYADRLAYWVSEPDRGIYDAMNKGIAVATGDYINFMNAGDCFASLSVLAQVAAQAPDEGPALLYGDVLYMTDGVPQLRKPAKEKDFWKQTPFCHQSAFFYNTHDEGIKYNLCYKLAGDHDVICRLHYRYNWPMVYIAVPIALYAGGGVSEHNVRVINEFQRIAREYIPAWRRVPYYWWKHFYERFSWGVRKNLGERWFGVASRIKNFLFPHKNR